MKGKLLMAKGFRIVKISAAGIIKKQVLAGCVLILIVGLTFATVLRAEQSLVTETNQQCATWRTND